MIKIIGSCIIIFTTSLIGFQFASRLQKRTQQLRDFQAGFQILASEISYGQVPLSTACMRIATQLTEPIAGFFRILSEKLTLADANIAQIFLTSLTDNWQKTALHSEEFAVIKQFGESLGKHDRYAQQQQIEIVQTHLKRIEKIAYDEQLKFEKMYKTLGILSGLMIAILLL